MRKACLAFVEKDSTVKQIIGFKFESNTVGTLLRIILIFYMKFHYFILISKLYMVGQFANGPLYFRILI